MMDLVCDDAVEEILLRLPLKYLHRLRAVSRRYNALVLRPGFATRYWGSHGPHLSGVFLQSERLVRPWGHRPCFLAVPGRRSESVLSSDLGFIPQMQTCRPGFCAGHDDERMIYIVHSACGLLLCCRGDKRQVHFYVCNPVTWQCVALPELPWPPHKYDWHSGLLTLAADGRHDGNVTSFQVVLVNHLSRWQCGGGPLVLKVFSSETGQWRAMEFRVQSLPVHDRATADYPTFLGQSGTAYWMTRTFFPYDDQGNDRVISYNSFYGIIRVIQVPGVASNDDRRRNRCLGERQDGCLRYAHLDNSVLEVWDEAGGDQMGVWWKLVHRVGVMELATVNQETTSFLLKARSVCFEGLVNLTEQNDLFDLISLHPAEDILYLGIGSSVAAYSMDRRAITPQSPRQCFSWHVFPYVHPPFPVLIPEINNSNKLPPSAQV